MLIGDERQLQDRLVGTRGASQAFVAIHSLDILQRVTRDDVSQRCLRCLRDERLGFRERGRQSQGRATSGGADVRCDIGQVVRIDAGAAERAERRDRILRIDEAVGEAVARSVPISPDPQSYRFPLGVPIETNRVSH